MAVLLISQTSTETPTDSSLDEDPQTPPPIQPDDPTWRVDTNRGSESPPDPKLPVRRQKSQSVPKLPTPAPTSGGSKSSNNLPNISPSLPPRINSLQARRTIMAAYHDTDNESIDSDEIITPARRKRPAAISESDMSDDSDDVQDLAPHTQKRPKNRKSDAISISDEEESSEDVVTPSVRRRRLQRASMTTQQRNSDITPARRQRPAATSEPEMSEDSDDVRGPTPRTRKRAKNRNADIISISDGAGSSEDALTPPVRTSRLKRAPVTTKDRDPEMDDESLQDIREDLEDLKETGMLSPNFSHEKRAIWLPIAKSSKEVRKTRTRGSQRTPKKTKAQEILESLKRRRAGEKGDGETRSPTETPSRSKRALYDSTSGDESSSSQAEENNEMDAAPIRRGENLDAYETDFIASDEEDGTIGVPPGLTDIPFEFTRHAHKKQRDHFNDVVEWMVHNKLNPAFPRDDQRYQVAFRKLDDEIQGLAGSKFISAAWNAFFFN